MSDQPNSKPPKRKTELRQAPQLPSDLMAEEALLNAMMMDTEAVEIAIGILPEADVFFSIKHQTIYQTMLDLFADREVPSLINIARRMQRNQTLEVIGGYPALIELSAKFSIVTDAESYAHSIRDMAYLRSVASAGQRIVEAAYDTSGSRDDLADYLQSELTKLTISAHTHGPVSIAELAERFYKRLQDRADGKIAATGIKTGFTELDKKTGGLQRSDMIIIAARPGTGKTSLALNIAEGAAKNDASIMIFSLEMSEDQLMNRMLSTKTGIDMQRVQLGDVRDHELQPLIDALGELGELPIMIDDTAGATLAYIRANAVKQKNTRGLDLLIIDYLQLMQGSGKKGSNRQEEVSEISRGIKALARELNVPIIALSQLSRDVEKRSSSNVPMLSDLRESGSLEQDADVVIFIYREELYNPETDKKGIADLHFAKHRNGPPGIVPLRFFRSTTKFSNLETYRHLEDY